MGFFSIVAFVRKVPAYVYLIAFLIASASALNLYVGHLKQTIADTQFAKDSVEAVNDSTHHELVGQIELASRLAVQTRILQTSLEKERKLRPMTSASVSATIEQVHDTIYALSVPQSGDTLTLLFKAYNEPFTLAAIVRTLPDGTSARLAYSITTDVMHLNVRNECGEPVNGVRSALVSFSTPPYFNIRLDTVSQSREVCNSHMSGESHKGRYALVAAASFVLGTKIVQFFHKGK